MNTQHFEIVKSYFPNSTTTKLISEGLKAFINQKQRDSGKQIMLISSLCPSTLHLLKEMDFNAERTAIHLGGIDGYPFAAMDAVENLLQVPDAMVLFIYGPHVMISPKPNRSPQAKEGTYLRACCNASDFRDYQRENAKTTDIIFPDRSAQVEEVIKLFSMYTERLTNAKDQTMEITDIFYEAIEERIKTIIKTKHSSVSILLFGGVYINYVDDPKSMCVPRNFIYLPSYSDEYQTIDILGNS